jgi:hypothetical protein
MSEIIDLTNDDMPSVAQPTRRPRSAPKCGYCGIQGHTVRTCNDPEVMNTLRQLQQTVNRFPQYETIINWLHTLELRVLQLIVCKYTYTAYRKNTKQMCIDILAVAIADQYRLEERRNAETTQLSLRTGGILLWTLNEDPANIPLLYRQYCGQFMYDETNQPPTEEECRVLCNIIQTRVLPPNIPYHTVKRFYRFILYKHIEFRQQNYTTQAENAVDSTEIKYVITRKNTNIPIQIECPICMENIETPNIITTTCGHKYCKDCITNVIRKTINTRCNCPLCRTPMYKLIQEKLKT